MILPDHLLLSTEGSYLLRRKTCEVRERKSKRIVLFDFGISIQTKDIETF